MNTINSINQPSHANSLINSRILGVPVVSSNYDAVVNQIIRWGKNREHRYVGVCNVHSITSSGWDLKLREALLDADLNTADGVGSKIPWM